MARMAVDIRSVLIPVTGERVLLPNATVAEVITYSTPDAVDGTPDWVLGRVVWRGWRVPVFSLPMLAGWASRENEAGAKIAVLKALGGNPDMPFMAMVTQGFPRLVTVTADSLEVLDGGGDANAGEPDAGEPDAVEPDAGDEEGSMETRAVADADEFPDDEPNFEDFSVEMDFGDWSEDTAEAEPPAEPAPASAEPAAEEASDDEPEQPGKPAIEGFDPAAAVVRVADERAVIPDLVPIERQVAEAIGPEILKSHRR